MNIGNKMKTQKGTSLLEVMLTLAVVGFGILGILYLQGDLSSGSAANKQHAEAIKLAEGRIEDIRNYYRYANDGSSTAAFSGILQTNYNIGYTEADACTDAPGEGEQSIPATLTRLRSETFQGENACYRITAALGYAATDNTLDAYVIASWTDRRNQVQEVKASTSITFNPAQLVASTLLPDDSTEAIVPAKGLALLGEGVLSDYGNTEFVSSNTDEGTSIYKTEDGDLLLVDTTKPDKPVLLMLPADTCVQLGVNCSFVTINGAVYIDTQTNDLPIDEVAIKSSDTTYCVKYGFGETATGDYRYFNYTCYASFGWHGNIGIVLLGGNKQVDKFCMGDPNSTGEPSYEWNPPVIGARRIYRGMYYVGCTSGDQNDPIISDGIECSPNTFSTAEGDPSHIYMKDGIPLYWSVGVNGGVDIGAPYIPEDNVDGQPLVEEPETDLDINRPLPTHDFVISKMSKNKTDGTYCVSEGVMMRPDSQDGKLFTGMNDDFFCLNQYNYIDKVYACTIDSGCYVPPTCPFDPSDPPIKSHTIAGIIGTDLLIPVYTSDGFEYCTYDNTGAYQCDVYDWGNGWTGYVGVDLPPLPETGPGESPNLGNTVCAYDRYYYTSLFEGLDPLANETRDFNCISGEHSSSIVRGVITADNNTEPDAIVLRQERTYQQTDDAGNLLFDTNGQEIMQTDESFTDCQLDGSSSNFSCVTADLGQNTDWSVELMISSQGYVCGSEVNNVLPLVDFEHAAVNISQITIVTDPAGCP
jgi:Tfp pilus assembly protein PilV